MMFLPLRAACCVCVGTPHSRPRLLVCIISCCCQSISALGCDWWISYASWFLSKYFPCNALHKLPDTFISFRFFHLKPQFFFFLVSAIPPTTTRGHTEHGHKIAFSIPIGCSPSAEWGDIYAFLCRTEMKCSPLEFTAVGDIWGIGGLVMSCLGWSRAEKMWEGTEEEEELWDKASLKGFLIPFSS